MKRRLLTFAALLTIIVGAGLMIFQSIQPDDSRKDYENYLLSLSHPLNSMTGESDSENPGMDKPDEAAFTEFVKTMDPELGRVPIGKLLEANRASESLVRMKSGGGDLVWEHHPSNIGGRTRAMLFDPNDPSGNRAFAGAVTGGLWVNENVMGDEPWSPVNDFWPNLSISCIAADPNNPQNMFIGTGESETALIIYRESSARGCGLMYSADGGVNWDILPSTKDWAYVTDLEIRDENGTSVIYAGVVSGIYKEAFHVSEPSYGLYRSDDLGETWTQVLPIIPGTDRPYAPSDIITSSDGQRLFVGTTYHGENWEGAACILYSDNGTTWTVMDEYYHRLSTPELWDWTGITYDHPGRIMLAAAPSDPDVIYAAVAGGYVRGDQFIGYDCRFILKSSDKGGSWTEVQNPPPRGNGSFAYLAWHALTLTVDPLDANTVWIGGLDVYRTTDSGENWQQMSYWAPNELTIPYYVHADIHEIIFKPGSLQNLFVCSDGGIFSTDMAQEDQPVFTQKNLGYSTLQYYSAALTPDPSERYFMGGLQDNGTRTYFGEQDPNNSFRLSGGDGALCFIDQDQPSKQITTVYYTSVYLWDIDLTDHVRLTSTRNFAFGTFINAMDYDSQYDLLYANGCDFHGYGANTLGVIRTSSGSISGGIKELPSDSPVPFTNIKWFENSGPDASTIYMGTAAGRLYRLEDAAMVGDMTELTGDDFPTAYISSIDIGETEDNLLVTFSNYGVQSVWTSTDAGATWRSIEGNLPDMPVRWGIFHPKNCYQIMLATEAGIWITNNAYAEEVVWEPANNGMANVRVDMLKKRAEDHMVLAGTHGRGMFTAIWEESAHSGLEVVMPNTETVEIFPNPTDGRFSILTEYTGEVRVTVSDLNGRVVLDEYVSSNGSSQVEMDLSAETNGTYIVRVAKGSKVQTARMIKR